MLLDKHVNYEGEDVDSWEISIVIEREGIYESMKFHTTLDGLTRLYGLLRPYCLGLRLDDRNFEFMFNALRALSSVHEGW